MNIDTNELSLGDEVIDPITGFKGKIIGFTQWFSGCAVASVQAPMNDKGEIPDHKGFDVTRVIPVAPAAATNSQRKTGGPQLTPPTTR